MIVVWSILGTAIAFIPFYIVWRFGWCAGYEAHARLAEDAKYGES